ncbi:MAG: 30S ribosomal protein S8e [Nanoarchaeota archaeon]
MKAGKKISGGRYKKRRKKKLYERPGQRRKVALGTEKKKTQKVMGGNKKTFLLKANMVNVMIGNKIQKLEIKNVLETPANRFLARQNILSKGTIVQTDKGKVRITNRPSQEGMINGVLIA